MVKRAAPLPIMNVMRHISVPNRQVEQALGLIREHDLLAPSMYVFPSEDGKSRLIPLDFGAPLSLPDGLADFDIVEHEGKPDERVDSDWWTHLSELLGEETVGSHGEAWPSSHEFFGDMMIVRLDDEVADYSQQIASAKLQSHPHIRLVLSDRGVLGELRIRDLTPIGARCDGEIISENIPDDMANTRVMVRESGRSILCDPTRAYFSTKLQSERLETLALAKELSSLLGRPLRVCDPFCGVGPALATLLGEPDLVGEVLASDLNPDAVEMLFDNLRRWDRRDYPSDPTPLSQIHPDRLVGVADATSLPSDPKISGNWDLLLVNLPHRTIDLLPSLVPLLDRRTPSLIRGRVIVAESDINTANTAIQSALPNRLEGTSEPELRIKRDYSSTLRLCSFEAWIASTSGGE
jgi:tRNA G37 N-methylase Trm5